MLIVFVTLIVPGLCYFEGLLPIMVYGFGALMTVARFGLYSKLGGSYNDACC